MPEASLTLDQWVQQTLSWWRQENHYVFSEIFEAHGQRAVLMKYAMKDLERCLKHALEQVQKEERERCIRLIEETKFVDFEEPLLDIVSSTTRLVAKKLRGLDT